MCDDVRQQLSFEIHIGDYIYIDEISPTNLRGWWFQLTKLVVTDTTKICYFQIDILRFNLSFYFLTIEIMLAYLLGLFD